MYRDKEVLNSFAKIAADEYLGKNQTALNTTLKKVASQEGLNPHQIEYVVAEANKKVWSSLYAMDKTASYDFPLADMKSILKDLQITHTKVAQVEDIDLDYLSAPRSTKLASFDPLKELGFIPEEIEKSAYARKEVKKQLQNRFEKLSMAKEEIERLIIVNTTELENLELQFVKTARALIMEEALEDRPQAMEKIAEFLAGCGDVDQGRSLIKKLSHVLKRQGLMKEADLKAPEQYISNKTPARIVNGEHALYITIKTIFDKKDYASNLNHRYEIVDSSLPVIKEKIREL